MKPTILALLTILAIVPCVAQNNNSVKQTPFSVWTVHTPDIIVEGRSPYPVGVLAPTQTNVESKAGNRITLSIVAPKPQFPPVSCMIMGLDITVQYELAAPKKAGSSEREQQ